MARRARNRDRECRTHGGHDRGAGRHNNHAGDVAGAPSGCSSPAGLLRPSPSPRSAPRPCGPRCVRPGMGHRSWTSSQSSDPTTRKRHCSRHCSTIGQRSTQDGTHASPLHDDAPPWHIPCVRRPPPRIAAGSGSGRRRYHNHIRTTACDKATLSGFLANDVLVRGEKIRYRRNRRPRSST